MAPKNQSEWNGKWQAQLAKGHDDLHALLERRLAAERVIEEVDLAIAMQLRLMELVAAQIVPPE
jgi:hypothetical protein